MDFHGEKRLNETHTSTTDPEARLFRKGKGKEAKLCFMGPVLVENRHGLIISPRLTAAAGTAEWEAAEAMMEAVPAGTALPWAVIRQLSPGEKPFIS